jgi:hypothetical protein
MWGIPAEQASQDRQLMPLDYRPRPSSQEKIDVTPGFVFLPRNRKYF